MYKYKNISELVQVVIGHGEVEPEGEIESATPIENPNFKYIGSEQLKEEVVQVEAKAPDAPKEQVTQTTATEVK